MEKFLRNYDVIDTGPTDRDPRKDTANWKKDRIAACRYLCDATLQANTSSAPEAKTFLSKTVEGLLRGFNDSDSDVRLAADECLNRVINGLLETHVYSLQVELYKEIKKIKPPIRPLRAALTKFAELAPLTRATKGPAFEKYLIPALVAVMKRNDDESLQETMRQTCKRIIGVFGVYFTHENTLLVLDAALANIASQSPVVRRSGCAVLGAVCRHLLHPGQFAPPLFQDLVKLCQLRLQDGPEMDLSSTLGVLETVSKIFEVAEERQDTPFLNFGDLHHMGGGVKLSEGVFGTYPLVLDMASTLLSFVGHQNANVQTAALDCLQRMLKVYETRITYLLRGKHVTEGTPESHRLLAADVLGPLLRLLVPHDCAGSRESKVSVKSLALTCLASVYAPCPALFTARVDVGAESPVSGRDLLTYMQHSDPLLRAGIVQLLGSFVQGLLINHTIQSANTSDSNVLPSVSMAGEPDPAFSLDGMEPGEPIGIEEIGNLCDMIGRHLWDDSSQTVKATCAAVGKCVVPLMRYAYKGRTQGLFGLQLLHGLVVVLEGNPYWLVQLEVLDILGSIPWVLVAHWEDVASKQPHGTYQAPLAGRGLQSLALDAVLGCLDSADPRTRECAGRCVTSLCTVLHYPADWGYVDPACALATRELEGYIHPALSTQPCLYGVYVSGDTSTVGPSPLYLDTASPRDYSLIMGNVSRIVSLVTSKLQGTLTHHPPHTSDVPFTHHPRTPTLLGCYTALSSLCRAYGNPDRPPNILDPWAEAAARSQRCLSSYLSDLLLPTVDLLTATDLCSDLTAHPQILTMLADVCRDMVSLQSYPHTMCILSHLLRVLNVCVHVYTHTQPPPTREGLSARSRRDSQNTIEQMCDFSSRAPYMELYQSLVRAEASSHLALSIGSPDRCQAMAHSALTATCVIISGMQQKIRPYSEILISYLRPLLPKATVSVLSCVHELAYALLSINRTLGSDAHWPEVACDTPTSEGVYGQWFERPTAQLASVLTFQESRGQAGRDTRQKRTAVVGAAIFGNLSIGVAGAKNEPARKPVSAQDKASNNRLLKQFEPLVVTVMNQYCNTADVDLQKGVLVLLARLVQLRINYSALDNDNLFVAFLFKQLEQACSQQLRRTPEVIGPMFQLFVLLTQISGLGESARDPPPGRPKREKPSKEKLIELVEIMVTEAAQAQTTAQRRFLYDCALAALDSVVFDVLLRLRDRIKPPQEQLTDRQERVFSLLLRLFLQPVALCMLSHVLWVTREFPEWWKSLSSMSLETFIGIVRLGSLPVTSPSHLTACYAFVDSLAPHSFADAMQPAACLTALVDSCPETRQDIVSGWLPLVLVVLRLCCRTHTDKMLSAIEAANPGESSSRVLSHQLLSVLAIAVSAVGPNDGPLAVMMLCHALLYVNHIVGNTVNASLTHHPDLLSRLDTSIHTLAPYHPAVVLLWLRILAAAKQPAPVWARPWEADTMATAEVEAQERSASLDRQVVLGPHEHVIGRASFLVDCLYATSTPSAPSLPMTSPTLCSFLLELSKEPPVSTALESNKLGVGTGAEFVGTLKRMFGGKDEWERGGNVPRTPLKFTPCQALQVLSILGTCTPSGTSARFIAATFLPCPYLHVRRTARSLLIGWLTGANQNTPQEQEPSAALQLEDQRSLAILISNLPHNPDVAALRDALSKTCPDTPAIPPVPDLKVLLAQMASITYGQADYLNHVLKSASYPSPFVVQPSAFSSLLVGLPCESVLRIITADETDCELWGVLVTATLDAMQSSQPDTDPSPTLLNLHAHISASISDTLPILKATSDSTLPPPPTTLTRLSAIAQAVTSYLAHPAVSVLAQTPDTPPTTGSGDPIADVSETTNDLSTLPHASEFGAHLLLLASRHPKALLLHDVIPVMACAAHAFRRETEMGPWWVTASQSLFALFSAWFPPAASATQLEPSSAGEKEDREEGAIVAPHTNPHRMLAAVLMYFRESTVENNHNVPEFLAVAVRELAIQLCRLDSRRVHSHILCRMRGEGYDCSGQYREPMLLSSDDSRDPDFVAAALKTVNVLGTPTVDVFNHTWAVLMEALDGAMEAEEGGIHSACLAIRGLVGVLQEHALYQQQWNDLMHLQRQPPESADTPLSGFPSLFALRQDLDQTVQALVSTRNPTSPLLPRAQNKQRPPSITNVVSSLLLTSDVEKKGDGAVETPDISSEAKQEESVQADAPGTGEVVVVDDEHVEETHDQDTSERGSLSNQPLSSDVTVLVDPPTNEIEGLSPPKIHAPRPPPALTPPMSPRLRLTPPPSPRLSPSKLSLLATPSRGDRTHTFGLLCENLDRVLVSPCYALGEGNVTSKSVPDGAKPTIDFAAYTDKLLVRFGQYIDSTGVNLHSPLLLTEMVRAAVLLTDLHPSPKVYQWIMDVFTFLSNAYSDVPILVPYLLTGMCKAEEVVGSERREKELPPPIRLLEQVLLSAIEQRASQGDKSPNPLGPIGSGPGQGGLVHGVTVSLEICLMQAVICLLARDPTPTLTQMLPNLMRYCTLVLEGSGSLDAMSRATSDPVAQAPRLYLAAIALMLRLVEVYPNETTLADFGRKCATVCVRMGCDRRTPDIVFHGLLRALERLLLRQPTLLSVVRDGLGSNSPGIDLSTVQRAFSSLALNLTIMYITTQGKGTEPTLGGAHEEYINTLFQLARRGLQPEAALLARLLPALLDAYYPTQMALTAVMGEYLGGTQVSAQFLTLVVMRMFKRLCWAGQGDQVRNMVLLSLNSFTQKYEEPVSLVIMTSLFVAVSSNKWIRALHPFVLRGLRNPPVFDPTIFLVSGKDFYTDPQLTTENKELFLRVFSLHDSPTYTALVSLCNDTSIQTN